MAMDTPDLTAAALVVSLALGAVLLVALRGRAESRRELARAHAETAELRARLDALTQQLEATSSELVETREAYLITDAGNERPEPNVPDQVVLSATLGEPLVKVVAFGHGLRRALSPESRNRIWFEMRREVRASRKRRRRAMKAYVREARAAERTEQQPDAA